MTSLPEVVARNVRQLREERGWSQRELARRLDELGGRWSRIAVTALEAQGKRGRDLLDLASLCYAFGVGVERLLQGRDAIDLPSGEQVPLWLLRNSLLGEVQDDVRRYGRERSQLLEDDPEEIARVAQRAGVSSEQLSLLTSALYGRSSFPRVRDERAGISAETPARSAQAKRGHATRAMLVDIERLIAQQGLEAAVELGRALREADDAMRVKEHRALMDQLGLDVPGSEVS